MTMPAQSICPQYPEIYQSVRTPERREASHVSSLSNESSSCHLPVTTTGKERDASKNCVPNLSLSVTSFGGPPCRRLRNYSSSGLSIFRKAYANSDRFLFRYRFYGRSRGLGR